MLAVWTGLEPATPCVTGTYSNQLNYQTNIFRTGCKDKGFDHRSKKNVHLSSKKAKILGVQIISPPKPDAGHGKSGRGNGSSLR